MLTKIFNGYILNPAKTAECVPSPGCVIVSDDTVIYTGPTEGYKGGAGFDSVIDARGGVIMPSFNNCHTHSAMTLFRSFADDLPLKNWLFDKIFPLEEKLSAEDVYWGAKLAALEYISGGVTAAADMYFQPMSTVSALTECGMRVVSVGSASDIGQDTERALIEAEERYLKFRDYSPLCTAKLGFHAEYTASDNLIKGIAALSAKYNTGVSAHLAETAAEVEECRNRHGVTPTERIVALGAYERGGDGYHCVFLSDDDRKLLLKRGVSIVTNPASNLKLASGIAPVLEYYRQGFGLALGTDGAASNNALDMFREMFLAAALQKVKYNDAVALPASAVLNMATCGGAATLGLGGDGLKAGARADIIVLNLDKPNMRPINNIADNIVYSGASSNVAMTMCNGRVLYRDGEFCNGIAADEIFQRCQAVIDRIR